MAYNPYYDLTPMERIRQANEEYRRVSMRNIIDQGKASEPEYEGLVVEDGGPDVSSELSIIDDNFRFLNVNINKLKDALSKVSPAGAPKKPPKPVDPKNPTQAEIDAKDLFDKENAIYKAARKIVTIQKDAFNSFVENATKCIFNLNSIIDNTKDIVKTIRNEGEENFNFSQLNDTYKLYNKFLKEYLKFRDSFGYLNVKIYKYKHKYDFDPSDNILSQGTVLADNSTARGTQILPGLEKISLAWDYTEEVNELGAQVVTLYEGIKVVSQEKGTRKLQYEGAGRYRDQRVYHSAWM